MLFYSFFVGVVFLVLGLVLDVEFWFVIIIEILVFYLLFFGLVGKSKCCWEDVFSEEN